MVEKDTGQVPPKGLKELINAYLDNLDQLEASRDELIISSIKELFEKLDERLKKVEVAVSDTSDYADSINIDCSDLDARLTDLEATVQTLQNPPCKKKMREETQETVSDRWFDVALLAKDFLEKYDGENVLFYITDDPEEDPNQELHSKNSYLCFYDGIIPYCREHPSWYNIGVYGKGFYKETIKDMLVLKDSHSYDLCHYPYTLWVKIMDYGAD